MKNFTFTLLLLCSVLFSNAQLKINELYAKPVNGDVNTEFFELSLDPDSYAAKTNSSVNSDSSMLVSYFDNGTEKGVYVIDLPSRSIGKGQFLFVAGRGRNATYQDSKTFTSTPHYVWNNSAISASGRKFILNSNNTWSAGTSLTAQQVNDIFSVTSATSGYSDMIVMLFKKSGSTMLAEDAFMATTSEDRYSIPDYVLNLPALNLSMLLMNPSGSSASSYNVGVDFSSFSDFDPVTVIGAEFTSESFYLCGSWDEVMLEEQYLTPNYLNSSSLPKGDPLQMVTECAPTNDTIKLRVISGDPYSYPIAVNIYNDINQNLKLDEADVFIKFVKVTSPNKWFNVIKPMGVTSFISVLDAAAYCYDDVVPFFCDPAIVTPVTFTSFNGLRKGGNVQLDWQTASESNNKGFYVERKVSGSEAWQTVTFVGSKGIGGNSERTLSYSFTDANNAPGITQYRLLQVDIDGKNMYSSVVSVRGQEQAGGDVTIFPNPSATGDVNIMLDGTTAPKNIIVSDILGRVVEQRKNVTVNSVQFFKLTSGMYNVRVQNLRTGKETSKKFMVQ